MAVGYKATDKNLQCRGFQYKVGETYEEENVRLCRRGFHYCENPLNVLDYYDLTESEFLQVEADRVAGDEQKSVTNKIHITANIGLQGFIESSFNFVWDKVAKSNVAASGSYNQVATSGDYSQVATAGHSSQVATSGYSSQVAASGYSSQVATSGDYSQVATACDYSKVATAGSSSSVVTSGNYSKVATTGNYSKVATSGDYSKVATACNDSQVATAGDDSRVATAGDDSRVAITGKDCIGANIGKSGRIKGSIGTWITLAEYDNNGIIQFVKSAKIDGKKLKADTWYTLKNKKFTIAE